MEEEKKEEQKLSFLEEIQQEREKLEKATAEMKEAISKFEEVKAFNIMGGKSLAGQAPPREETPEEKWAREAKIRYAGTGLDPTPIVKNGI